MKQPMIMVINGKQGTEIHAIDRESDRSECILTISHDGYLIRHPNIIMPGIRTDARGAIKLDRE